MVIRMAMTRAWSLVALLTLIVTGCGVTAPVAHDADQVSASGLLSPKLPEDRPLTAAERQGDFDRFLSLATAEALAWQRDARLTAAQATNVDAQGGKAGGTTYVYAFAAGRHGLSVTVTGANVVFAKAKPGTPLETKGLVPASVALSCAVKAGSLSTETYVVALAATAAGPVYLVREFKREGAAQVTIDARTGDPIQ